MNRKMKYFILGLVAIAFLLASINGAVAARPDGWKNVGGSESELSSDVKSQDPYSDSIVTANPLPFGTGNPRSLLV